MKEEIFIRIFIRIFSAGEEVKMGKRVEYLPLNDLKWRYLFIYFCAQPALQFYGGQVQQSKQYGGRVRVKTTNVLKLCNIFQTCNCSNL